MSMSQYYAILGTIWIASYSPSVLNLVLGLVCVTAAIFLPKEKG